MKNQIKNLLLSTFIIPLFLLSNLAIAQSKASANTQLEQNYLKLWAKADSLDNVRLPKSALAVVNDLYATATAENNKGNWVKSIIYKLKYTSYTEENAFLSRLIEMNKEALLAPFPVQQFMHTMLAEMYWQYYQENRYKFLSRTATVDFENTDISTWDLKRIVSQVKYHYTQSLAEPKKLQSENIDDLAMLLIAGNQNRALRPTLYDFLANRAIDFYTNSESSITQPAEIFVMDNPEYFAKTEQFCSLTIQTKDTLNFKYIGLKLLQEWLQFRLSQKNTDALVDADLKRIVYVYNSATGLDKDENYLKALTNIQNAYSQTGASAQANYLIANWWYIESQKYKPLQSDAHKWEAKKAKEICSETIKKYSDTEGSQNCKSLLAQIENKELSIISEKVNPINEPSKCLITYRNISKIFVRVIKTTKLEYDIINAKTQANHALILEQEIIKHYAQKPTTHQWAVDLPNSADNQTHSAEVKIPACLGGTYIYLIGTDSTLTFENQAVSYEIGTVSDISYVHKTVTETGAMEFFVLNRKTGVPLANCTAQIWDNWYDANKNRYEHRKGKIYITNKQGYFTIPFSNDNNKQQFNIEFAYKNDKLFTSNISDYHGYNASFSMYQPYKYQNENRKQTYFFTDRAIYRPGQTIFFKGITLTSDGKNKQEIKKNFSTNVGLYNVNNAVVATLSLVTSEYGSFSGSFTIPTNGLNGNMRIGNDFGSIYISVEDYKRPKFEVKIPAIKNSFRLGEIITISGNAKAYSGTNIDNAKVEFRVVRVAEFPYWWFYKRGYFPESPEMEVCNGITKTDAKGEFQFQFPALADASVDKTSNPIFKYTVYANITDQNGETRSVTKTIAVGYQSLKLKINIPEIVNQNDTTAWTIESLNLNDEAENTKGTVKIYKLENPKTAYRTRPWQQADSYTMNEKEYRKDFPYDEYANEGNPAIWKKSQQTANLNFDTEKGKKITLPALQKWETGRYIVEATTTDKFGELVSDISYFTLISKKATKLPYPAIDQFLMLKAQGEPGEKAEILLGSSHKINVLYEVEHDSKIITRQWFVLNNEQKLVEFPLLESHRGNIGVHFTFIDNNRLYKHSEIITIPYSNKTLNIGFETFRNNLLPGEKETWKLRISGKNGDKVAAEMVATLYDASLDVFRANNFNFFNYPLNNISGGWASKNGFDLSYGKLYSVGWSGNVDLYNKIFDNLNWFGYNKHHIFNVMYKNDEFKDNEISTDSDRMVRLSFTALSSNLQKKSAGVSKKEMALSDSETPNSTSKKPVEKPVETPIKARTNFKETAFFYPNLHTDANGDILISFTIPEAFTRWRMLGFAHTQDLKFGFTSNELITQKPLMITTNAPRFFRENDKIIFTAKVANLSENTLHGNALLYLFDAITLQPIDTLFGEGMKTKKLSEAAKTKKFVVNAGQSVGVSWELSIPEAVQAISYRVVAKSGNFSDSEEMTVPVLTNRMLVTESLPISVRSRQTKSFTLDKLVKNSSSTLRNHKLTLEFNANPAWYAIQALPYLMEYPYQCAEQLFCRLYANSIAAHIANSNPKIKRVFDSWKYSGPQALVSNLEKNQELKSLMLEETPWVMQATNESERKKRVGLLFDLNKMANEEKSALEKLEKMQASNGSFPWFDGMKENWYITQHIVSGLGHLKNLGINISADNLTAKAIEFIDGQIKKTYEELLLQEKKHQADLSANHLGYMEIQYLYARSFFINIPVSAQCMPAMEYYKGQAQKYWVSQSMYMQGMLALCLQRFGIKDVPIAILKSIKEYAIINEEMGMYWKNDIGYNWYQAPIETQSLLIEAFDEITNDKKVVEDLTVWLLKNKQTNDWKTTKATSEACYALLLRGTAMLASEPNVQIKVGTKIIDPKKLENTQEEAGTGYFKTSWSGSEILPDMGKITVIKQDEGLSWGAIYWQYFEQLDKITPHKTPLKLIKRLFVQTNTPNGPVLTPMVDNTTLQPGDLVKVRIELRVDRAMEYVHMKDMRAAAFEPLNVISQFKYQDGLGYYESTRDAATNFFFDYLPKGTYIFEYALRATHAGDFSNGITSIQSMYAPEFSSHSQGMRVRIEE